MITAHDLTAAAASGVRFDAAPHRYYAGALELPSVTGVLKGVGVSLDFERLVENRLVSAEALEEKRALGQAVHAATHYYDESALRADSVDPRVVPYLESWIQFRGDTGFAPALLETVLWHPGFLFAGTIDRAGKFGHFESCDPHDLYTVDIKCGDPDDAGARWQTAAYQAMLALSIATTSRWSQPLLVARPRYSVHLQVNGRYKLHRYDDSFRDWSEFQAFLTTYRRQHARRQAVACA